MTAFVGAADLFSTLLWLLIVIIEGAFRVCVQMCGRAEGGEIVGSFVWSSCFADCRGVTLFAWVVFGLAGTALHWAFSRQICFVAYLATTNKDLRYSPLIFQVQSPVCPH